MEKQSGSARQRKAKKVTKHGSSFLCPLVPDPETLPAEGARRNYTVKKKKRVDAARSEERRKSDQSMLKMSVRSVQKKDNECRRAQDPALARTEGARCEDGAFELLEMDVSAVAHAGHRSGGCGECRSNV